MACGPRAPPGHVLCELRMSHAGLGTGRGAEGRCGSKEGSREIPGVGAFGHAGLQGCGVGVHESPKSGWGAGSVAEHCVRPRAHEAPQEPPAITPESTKKGVVPEPNWVCSPCPKIPQTIKPLRVCCTCRDTVLILIPALLGVTVVVPEPHPLTRPPPQEHQGLGSPQPLSQTAGRVGEFLLSLCSCVSKPPANLGPSCPGDQAIPGATRPPVPKPGSPELAGLSWSPGLAGTP